jgi:carbonic anhydrase
MTDLQDLLERNRQWSEGVRAADPDFFANLAKQQAPEYLWIGCSDSRVPANQITGLAPGEVFVHRNVANLVIHTDLNALSAIQFAVDVLRVKHVIVVGHYGCSGVRAALTRHRIGLSDNWLRHIQDVHQKHRAWIDGEAGEEARYDLLCELNVLEQALSVCQTTVVQEAWERGQQVAVHGWIYGLADGRLRDLGFRVGAGEEPLDHYDRALEELRRSREGRRAQA